MKIPLKRYLTPFILEDLKSKILLITGPRQCGKTTLSKNLNMPFDYLNYDERKHHKALLDRSWDRKKKYIIFDELHKKKNWKLWLKGIYDTEGTSPGIIVTGSARLDTYKRMGDSLAGRFFQFRLHPFDIKEVHQLQVCSPQEALNKLLNFSGFPEPFLKSRQTFYGKWKKSQLDIILRQDIITMEAIKNLSSIESLVQLLRDRVGSPVSYTSLAEDLDCAPKTIKNWLQVLENLYVVFKVVPWHKNIARSLKKSPKYYFYDIAQVRNKALRLENLIACALLKEIHLREDTKGEDWNLFYLKNKSGKEVDFLTVKEGHASCMIEVKTSKDELSKGIKWFSRYFHNIRKVQLVQNLDRKKHFLRGRKLERPVSGFLKWIFNVT